MLICGVKATHDGGVALIDGNRLVFSIEVEKLANAPRYSALDDLGDVHAILRSEGVDPADVDRFVIDGWLTEMPGAAPNVTVRENGRERRLPVAPYGVRPYSGDGTARDPLRRYGFTDHDFGGRTPGYTSFSHSGNHLLGAYCSSPFAAHGESALVLVWDGAMTPRIYHVDAATRVVRLVAELFPLLGTVFADFCGMLEPFHRDVDHLSAEMRVRHHLGIAGKAMAYAALGEVNKSSYPHFTSIIEHLGGDLGNMSAALCRTVSARRDELFPEMTDADLIATFQEYLGDLLCDSVGRAVHRHFPGETPNLCMVGGCALNIKWSNRLRRSGLFADVWIPPFPNDSGAAIGTACCEMYTQSDNLALEWDVYSGPALAAEPVPGGWRTNPCDERQVADILHREGEPVVVLDGRAELGPRALGNRSILAPATDVRMRDRLNVIKDRAGYRPVAPICLESRAHELFRPGTCDRYMVFEHTVIDPVSEHMPAIVHLDGTARLQVISPLANSRSARILAEYEKFSGIPVLCNTSANFSGCGFFPDVASAARWGRTKYIWSKGVLYTNPNPVGPPLAPPAD